MTYPSRPLGTTMLWAISALAGPALAGCGGAAATALPAVSAGNAPARGVTVQFRIVVPPKTTGATVRGPRYVSASTQSASVAVTPQSGAPGAPVVVNCSAAVCSGQIPAPVGLDTFTVKLFDRPNAGGNLLGLGATTQNIVLDAANSVNVAFDGVVNAFGVALSPGVLAIGTKATVVVTVTFLDAGNNAIVGSNAYVDKNGNAVTASLSDSDSSGATKLSATALTAPGMVNLTYDGSAIPSPTISAVAAGITVGRAILSIGAARALYVGSSTGGSSPANAPGEILGFPRGLSASGNVAPVATVAGADTQQPFTPNALAADAAGALYEGVGFPGEVNVFAAGANGDTPPLRSFGDAVATTSLATAISFDPNGRPTVVFSSNQDASQRVDVFAPGATGFVQPAVTLSGVRGVASTAYDASGDLLLLTYTMNAFAVYPPGAQAPSRTIVADVTNALDQPSAIAVDAAGYRYVANAGGGGVFGSSGIDSVTVYAPGATGYVAPVRTIAGAASGLSNPAALTVGPNGNVYVLNLGRSTNGAVTVTEYAGGPTGSASPVATLPASFASSAGGSLAVTSDGTVFVSAGTALVAFAPGSTTAQPVTSSSLKSILSLAADPAGGGLLVLNASALHAFQLLNFASSARSNATPATTRALNVTTANWLQADAQSDVWVGAADNQSISATLAFVPAGAATPSRTMSVPAIAVTGFALDPAGTIDVTSSHVPFEVDAYPQSGSGTVTRVARIRGGASGCFLPGASGKDGSGNLYFSCQGDGSIRVYEPTATTIVSSILGLPEISGIAVDADGTLYAVPGSLNTGLVNRIIASPGHGRRSASNPRSPRDETPANAQEILVYAAGASGEVAPAATIAGSATGIDTLGQSSGIAIGGAPGSAVTQPPPNKIVVTPPGPLVMALGGATLAVTVSETGYAGGFTVSSSDPAVASAGAVTNGSFNVTAVSVGATTIITKDANGKSGNLVVLVNADNVTVNGKQRR